MTAARIAAAALLLALHVAPASAQAVDQRPNWEASAGAVWFFGTELGSSTATLERPGGQPFELFRTETSIDGGAGVSASIAWFPADRIAIEAAFSYARPGISTRVTADAEDAPSATASVAINQYLADGSVRWYLTRRLGGFEPYLRAGAGYLRQLDAANAHVKTGTIVHAGAGLDRLLSARPAARIKRIGLRLDARLLGRSGGIGIDDEFRISAAAGASLFFAF